MSRSLCWPPPLAVDMGTHTCVSCNQEGGSEATISQPLGPRQERLGSLGVMALTLLKNVVVPSSYHECTNCKPLWIRGSTKWLKCQIKMCWDDSLPSPLKSLYADTSSPASPPSPTDNCLLLYMIRYTDYQGWGQFHLNSANSWKIVLISFPHCFSMSSKTI